MEDRSAKYRAFYAQLICAATRAADPRIEEAFRTVRREPFVGPGPWSISVGSHPYVVTPDDDPAFVYQNTLLALDSARGLNIGMPGAHAYWLGGCAVKEGETVVQIGAGSGYYTAILAHLVGPGGRVHAYEIDERLAGLARENLKDIAYVDVRDRTGIASDLPKADVIYVCARGAAGHRMARCAAARRAAGVSARARRHPRRHADGHAPGRGCSLARQIPRTCPIHRLRRIAGCGFRPETGRGVRKGMGERAVSAERGRARPDMLVCR